MSDKEYELEIVLRYYEDNDKGLTEHPVEVRLFGGTKKVETKDEIFDFLDDWKYPIYDALEADEEDSEHDYTPPETYYEAYGDDRK